MGKKKADIKDLILEALNKGITKSHNEKNKDRTQNVFHPSALGSCIRSIYYDMLGAERVPLDTRVMRIFDNGHSAHERYTNYFKKAGVHIADELLIRDDEWNIEGSADDLIIIDKEIILIDEKTIGNFPFEKMLQGQLRKTYMYQLNCYMWLLGLKRGFFLYENKNTQHIHIKEVKFDPKIITDIKKRVTTVMKAIIRNTPPKGEYTLKDWQCRYCGYNKHCWPSFAESTIEFKVLPLESKNVK